VTITGFAVQNATSARGIRLQSVHHCTVSGNNASGNHRGIYLSGSSNNTLTDNTALDNYYGIFLEYSSNNNNLAGNTANSNSNDGIYLRDSCNNNTLTDNTVNSNNNNGIHLYSSSNNTLMDNTANSNTYYGIILDHSSNNTLTDNTANSNNWHGFYIHESSTTNTLAGNTANSNNEYGIRLAESSNNTLTGNIASNNKFGIFVGSSNNNTLTNNVANSNIDGGISLVDSSNNNHIYNNYFNNTNNAYDDGTNIWNITETSGTNIIGGPNLGGNYWSDYTGEDTNDDGLGDTQRPYNASGNIVNGGDWLPLVKAEELIFDTGEGSYPSISGTFTGTITPSRNLTLNTLYTYSCTGTGGHTKSIELYEYSFLRATGMWSGYQGDWRNITFTKVALLKDHEYRYIIVTGSYPQVVHAESKNVTGGKITYTDFVDINGKQHENWMPAIKLYFVKTSVDDLTFEEARAIALTSTCVQEGTLTDTCIYNEYSHTWWFGLEPFTENPNCNPACVVSEDARTAEINWRCTMATP
jgi:parallel beta-helix repeat protein